MLGRKVLLRGDPGYSTVVGCATPIGETIFQYGKRGKKYRCQGSFIVRSDFGRDPTETPVPRSVVRARIRASKTGLCPDTPYYNGSEMRGLTRRIEIDAARGHYHPYDAVGDIPFPHRVGSSPCCKNSPINPQALDRLYAAWSESGEESDFNALSTAVRMALPKHLRATKELETREQIERGIKAVRDHCWSVWLDKEARSIESKKSFQRRVNASKRSMIEMDIPITKSARKRSWDKSSGDFGTFMRKADLFSENQFLARSPEEQRRIVRRAFRRARKSIPGSFNIAQYEGRELLGRAVVEFSRGETLRR